MPAPKPAPIPPAFDVQLERRDFLYYTWVLALKRPVLPFLLYSFIFLFLLGITGVWPTARVFSLAVFAPLLGYLFWVWISAGTLWARFPALREVRHYHFTAEAYRLETPQGEAEISYEDVEVLSSRRALYLIRGDGSADILPRDALPEGLEAFLADKFEIERSSFL